jgi:hypothetical protein
MKREDLLKDIAKVYAKWETKTKFTSEMGASLEDESKIMDEILTLVKKYKQ